MPKLDEIPLPLRRRLYLPAYTITEAARYAGIHKSTVAYWHYKSGRYGPTLPGKEKGRALNYFQLIEVGVVASFRRSGMRLKSIASARNYMARVMQSEYPFVEFDFKERGFHMLVDLQEVEPDPAIGALILTDAAGQMKWKDQIEERLSEFEYEHDVAMQWHVAGRASSVLIDPRISFGAPAVRGVPTWVLASRVDADEEPSEIAEDFGIDEADVIEALTFEGIPMAA